MRHWRAERRGALRQRMPVGLRFVDAVGLERARIFLRKIERFRRGGLQAEREFVTGDARRQFGIARRGVRMLRVQRVDEIDLAPLHVAARPGGRFQIQNGLARGAQDGALIHGRHVAARPIRRAGRRAAARIQHHDIAGQVLVERAEAVAHPGADGGMALQDAPAVHLQHRAAVRERIAVERFDDRQLVHVLRDVRKRVGTPQAGLAVLLERPPAGLQRRLRLGVAAEFVVDRLPVALLQLRFVVEQIQLRRARRT